MKCRSKEIESTGLSENIWMKSNRKTIPFIFLSLLCGIIVAALYLPFPPWLNATRLWFFEFPPFSLSILISMTCLLFAGMFLGRMARNYAVQAESRLQLRFASVGTFLNAIILILPLLNLISILTPRTITRVVDFKIEEGGYLCAIEFEAKVPWGQEVNFDDNTVVYEQGQKVDQHKEIVSVDSIQPGQVVEIQYMDKDTSIWGIKALSITILEGQYRPYNNENCGNALP